MKQHAFVKYNIDPSEGSTGKVNNNDPFHLENIGIVYTWSEQTCAASALHALGILTWFYIGWRAKVSVLNEHQIIIEKYYEYLVNL
jgi:hypothetical protein